MNVKDSLIPQKPIPDGADEFSKKVQGLLDGRPKDEATVSRALEGMDAMLDAIAAGSTAWRRCWWARGKTASGW